MNQITEQISAIFLAIVGVAILAVLVSRRSNTAGVLSAFGGAFSQALGTAVSPVTGSTMQTAFGASGGFLPGY